MNVGAEVRLQMKRLKTQGRRPERILCSKVAFEDLLCDPAVIDPACFIDRPKIVATTERDDNYFRLYGMPIGIREGVRGVLVLAEDHVDPQGASKPGRRA